MSATPVPRRPADPRAPDERWQVSGGMGVDVDDIYALSAACRVAAQTITHLAPGVIAACLRGEAALAALGQAIPGVSSPGGAAIAGSLVVAPRYLPPTGAGFARLGLQLALAAERYAGTEQNVTTVMLDLIRQRVAASPLPGAAELLREPVLRDAGTTLGYLERLTGDKGAGTGPGVTLGADATVDPDSLIELAGGPLVGAYPRREASVGEPADLGPVPPPAGVAGLLALVHGRAGKAAQSGPVGDPPPGRVDVVAVRTSDAQGRPDTAYVVALPGTTDWSLPGQPLLPDIRNVRGNLELISGNSTAELAALPAALAAAGVPAGAKVAFVGHSQGGMTSYAAASAPGIADRYRVTHVVTAGSPIGAMAAPPRGVRTLSLENTADPVPGCDGRPNANSATRVTVSFEGSPDRGQHDLDQYVAAGQRIDGNDDPRLTEFSRSLREEGYVAGPGGTASARATRVELRLPTP